MTKKEFDIVNQDLLTKSTLFSWESSIEAMEKNALLYVEKNFSQRMVAIDFIGFQVIDRVEELLLKTVQPDKLILLKNRAEKLNNELEEINSNLFERFRATIRVAGFKGNEFKNLIKEWFDFDSGYDVLPEEPRYDNLDIFINELLFFQVMPDPVKDLEPEMVFYQKTPARIVYELVEKVHFQKGDVFVDLGAGLGQVTILVNLLAGISARGIEFEPAFCAYARNCARELNLSEVDFVNTDAREADYSEGTVFFMFSPFKGGIMETVLALLRKESSGRKIKIITYGPCTLQVAQESWLGLILPEPVDIYKLCVFSSI